ncbi:MAG: glycosyltransferase family 1 protein, partial [Alphaproteobacteria bacterium]
MRIAFYAPMKPPDHPVPSGDRRMAGLLMAALRRAGHQPVLASRLRTWTGDEGMAGAASRAVLRLKSAEQAAALVRRWRDAADRPDLWFTYHLFHKAPDGIGPVVARELAIPYVVAEASVAPKRRTGPWAAGHAAVVAALGQAAAVIALNPADRACVLPCLADGRRLYDLPPFLDARPYVAARRRRAAGRARLATAHALDPATPWLIAVAMMRPGDKLASWRLLAKALLPLATPAAQAPAWHLLAVGDGPAGEAVRRLFRPLARHM